MRDTNPAEPRKPTRTWLLNSVPWVPHYTRADTFVAPGGSTRTSLQLMLAGAQVTEHRLWRRNR